MILVDTSYLIALFDATDPHFARALAWSPLLFQRLLVPQYVLWETVNFFSSPIDRPKAHAIVDYVRSEQSAEMVAASDALFKAGLSLHAARMDKSWSLTDCISFHLMRERGITQALTTDHHFTQAGFDALLRRDPL